MPKMSYGWTIGLLTNHTPRLNISSLLPDSTAQAYTYTWFDSTLRHLAVKRRINSSSSTTWGTSPMERHWFYAPAKSRLDSRAWQQAPLYKPTSNSGSNPEFPISSEYFTCLRQHRRNGWEWIRHGCVVCLPPVGVFEPTEARQLRAERVSGATYAELCSRYSLSKSAVSYIVHGKTHKQYEGRLVGGAQAAYRWGSNPHSFAEKSSVPRIKPTSRMAQLVECKFDKLDVTGSSPVTTTVQLC